MLGFERKARLFCDADYFDYWRIFSKFLLGFERKARLFCDFLFLRQQLLWLRLCWDLSVRLGYFVTSFHFSKIDSAPAHSLGFERKARLFCDNPF